MLLFFKMVKVKMNDLYHFYVYFIIILLISSVIKNSDFKYKHSD